MAREFLVLPSNSWSAEKSWFHGGGASLPGLPLAQRGRARLLAGLAGLAWLDLRYCFDWLGLICFIGLIGQVLAYSIMIS